MEITLRRQGFQVFTAASGQEALEVLARFRGKVNMVLMDVRMPGLDGPDTLTALRRVTPGVRCCFMSGDLGHRTPEELLRLGAERVFYKPFPVSETAQELWRLAQVEP
jgi:CheY-like chemotaxis protein